MKTCLIIPSFNRAHHLKITLRRLKEIHRGENIEIVVINDGLEDETEEVTVKSGLPYKYFFTGQRHKNGLVRRNPGLVHNIGVRNSDSDNIIITGPEIYLWSENSLQLTLNAIRPKALVTPRDVIDDQKQIALNNLEQSHNSEIFDRLIENIDHSDPFLSNPYMPYWLAITREDFESIRGYDEDLIGICSDDNDLLDRLKWNGSQYDHQDFYAIHLYHPKPPPQTVMDDPMYKYNLNIRQAKGNSVIRNLEKDWGKL